MSDVTKEAMRLAIYGQESGQGKADTSEANYAGARGPMQVTMSTFEGLKGLGVIPKDWSHANPEHTKEAGNRLVDRLFDKYAGDPRKVAAAYYGGEKAVRPDGSIAELRDRKNPKAPTTLQYADQVLARLGAVSVPAPATTTAESAGGASGAPERAAGSVLAGWTQGMPDSVTRIKDIKEADTPLYVGPSQLPTGAGVVPTSEALAVEEAGLRARTQRADETTGVEMAKAAFIQNTFTGAGIRALAMQQYEDEHRPDPNYTLDPKELSGLDSHEQEFLRQAHSKDHEQRIKREIANRRDDLDTVNIKGTGLGIAATLAAGLPEGVLTGMGTARAMMIGKVSSLQYAAKGERAAALGASAAENIGGNVALVAAQQRFDPYVSTDDYAMAVAFGALGTGFSAAGIFGKADAHSLGKAAEAAGEAAAARTVAKREQALKNLGEGATDDALMAEVKRLEANEVRKTVADASAGPGPNRRLMPEDEAIRADAPEAAAKDAPITQANEPISESARPKYDNPDFLAQRTEAATSNPEWQKQIGNLTNGELDFKAAEALPTGKVHFTKEAAGSVQLNPAREAVASLVPKFLKDAVVVVGKAVNNVLASGEIISAGKVHFIGLKGEDGPTGSVRTAVHEVGHAVFHEHAKDIPAELLQRMRDDHAKFLTDLRSGNLDDAVNRRFGLTSPSRDASAAGLTAPKSKSYIESFDEYSAEQFVKYVESSKQDLGLTKQIVARIKDAVNAALDFFRTAKRRGYIDPDESFAEFFARVLEGNLKQAQRADEFLSPDLVFPSSFNKPVETTAAGILNDPVAQRHGLGLIPVGTPTQQAEAKAVIHMYKQAETLGVKTDETRLSKLMNSAVFKGAQSAANTLLRSANPVARMLASELLESPGGAGGRRSTAAIAKHMLEQKLTGNTLNTIQDIYTQFRKDSGVPVTEDFFGGKTWTQFNRLVAEEMESRRPGKASVESPETVKMAADELQNAYERLRTEQVQTKTIGWASLPETAVGYMPHKMSPEKVLNMSTEQGNALHSALIDQFVGLEGFDITFANKLAMQYIDRVRVRARGGFDAPIGIHQTGAGDVVREALEQMGMGKGEIESMMKKYMAGGASHTKQRLNLDLNVEYPLPDGTSFRLMDLFETDQFKLLRSQVNRVSGEVALAKRGIMGKPGMALARRAMEFGSDVEKVTADELKAFDQVAAEFFGDPFGTESKFANRVMQVNSLARLGGMGFTQFAEAINGVFHVGAVRTLESIGSMGRLRSEIKKLAKGEKVDNPVLGSIEQFGGAEFGTESYKTVFPFDNPSLEYHTYGKDTLNAADRLLRGGSYAQAKLSMWRTIHATQQRGMAEQIVRKAAQLIKDGTHDVALADMGIDAELIGRLRKDIDAMAQFENGRLTNFDLTKATDGEAADAFAQSIHRGVSQIIQGTFIGERGVWAHDGLMRIMTQFRTFSLTSVEKQWARQVGNVGTAKALGMVVASMSMAAPIYMARTYLSSIGRKDQEAYLEKQLSAAQIARASLNYIAMSGLAGDFLDATTALTGVGKVTGGRTGASSAFVGNMVAPSVGLADDIWRGLQNTKEGTDPHDLIKSLPFSKLPVVMQAVNALGD